jgi:hypothetical protein
MNDWTAMTRSRRYTFPNPLPSLFDRVAAVKAVAGDVPVDGRIVFSDRGRFPKGKPPQVVMLDALSQEFPVADRSTPGGLGDNWLAAWASLTSQVKPSPLARR